MFSLSVLIPLTGYREILKSIESIAEQNYDGCEVLILRNNISDMPKGIDVLEKNIYEISKLHIREYLICSKGKGNALNIGIQYATNDFICILDSDSFLEKDALSTAMRHFEDDSVSAVGGRLKVVNEKKNIIVFLQKIEYMKTFNIWRRIFNLLDANYLISGAYGIFRKCDIISVNGYDTETVGEDMDIVLSMQEMMRGIGRKILYEKDSICYTKTPATLCRLIRQRDRWQRGLLDCLIKHRKLIFNPRYGLLGCFVIPYQIITSLLGPFFFILYLVNLIIGLIDFEVHIFCLFIYISLEIFLTCHAEYLETRNNYVYITGMPKAIVAVVFGMLLMIPLSIARLYGMLTFYWRKTVW